MFATGMIYFANLSSTYANLITWMIVVLMWIYQSHISRHLLCGIGSNQHSSLIFLWRQRSATNQRSISRFGKGHKIEDKCFLIFCGLNIDEFFGQSRFI